RDPLPGELRGKPSARIVPTDRGKWEPQRMAAAVGRARQPFVMQQDGFAVRSQANIELDPAATERLGPAQPGERIFRSATRGAAMSDHRRQSRRCGDGRRQAWSSAGRPLRLLAARAEVLAGLLIDLTHAELDLAAVVEAQHFDLDRVAELNDV